MQLRGVHHVSLNVSDTDAAERFYMDVLGLEKILRPDFGFAGSWLALCRRPPGPPARGRRLDGPKGQHFAFEVDDLDATRAELAEPGVKVSEPNVIPGIGRQSFFKDPSGNLIEVNEPAAEYVRPRSTSATPPCADNTERGAEPAADPVGDRAAPASPTPRRVPDATA